MPIEDVIEEFQTYTGQKVSKKIIREWKFVGLNNVDFLTTDFLNRYGLKNLIQFEDDKYINIPPKDIQNAIWGTCFDYKDFNTEVSGQTVRERIYQCWNTIHLIVKDNQDWFIKYVKENNPDNRR
jgi:hypothetical protein